MSHFFVLGGSGRTGGHIIDYALSKGHTVTALVRDPAKLISRAGLTVVQGTPVNRGDVDGAIDGADAVIVALNSTRRSDTPWAKPVSPPRLMADSVANATGAMTARGIRRIVVLSAFGVGDSLSSAALPLRWMFTRTNLKYTYADHNLLDAEIRDTDTDWTLLRPAALNNKASTGKIAVTDVHGPKPSFSISRAAVAHFAVDVIDSGAHIREAPVISQK
jgi:putative NADH-flavin reductase